MDEREEPQRRHAPDGRMRLLFTHDLHQLTQQALPSQLVKKMHPHRAANQVLGMRGDMKAEALFKADGPEYPCRVLDKRQIV